MAHRTAGGSAWIWGGLGTLVLAAVLLAPRLHWGQALEPATFAYAQPVAGPCPPSDLQLPEQDVTGELASIQVRAPRNYLASHAHPLLVVYSPAGFSAGLTERFTGLTHAATGAGMLVAYVGSRRLTPTLPSILSRVPAVVARRWCVDPRRIVLAGHSDGGTLAQVIALQAEVQRRREMPFAIAASGAGLREADFSGFSCPASLHVLLFHGQDDDHFPGFGASAARAWARCLSCDADPVPEGAGCLRYSGCSGSLLLCLHPGGHPQWPADAGRRIVELIAASGAV